jgi:ParB-like chromosome segregation protein Spo0J
MMEESLFGESQPTLSPGDPALADAIEAVVALLKGKQGAELVDSLNAARAALHEVSPFRNEPVDFVRWVANTTVYANDYNPNSVAPPEMELLRLSIDADGYTQPIVSTPDADGRFEVVDGFHRHRVGKEMPDIARRVQGYLPLVCIRETQTDKSDRMASTIRHNRARGKHRVEAMSEIVIELKKRNWSDEKIAKNLGMEPDEVLRLCQISGLADLFSDSDFSASWDVDDFDEVVGIDLDGEE